MPQTAIAPMKDKGVSAIAGIAESQQYQAGTESGFNTQVKRACVQKRER